ncbi:hypothetical protein OAG47_00235 [Verrucomicrobiales bacterium]|jgi:hypothetical protein|nr:hypothetical protein [Verrucomicrobiales bacterium]
MMEHSSHITESTDNKKRPASKEDNSQTATSNQASQPEALVLFPLLLQLSNRNDQHTDQGQWNQRMEDSWLLLAPG